MGTVYGNNIDLYAKRETLVAIGEYLEAQSFTVPGSTAMWWPLFLNATVNNGTAKKAFWSDLSQWLNSTQGSFYGNRVQWVDPSEPSLGVSNIKIAESTLIAFQ